MARNIHEGRNVKRFREMLGIQQEGLAWQLGEDWNQQRISLLEQKETIDPKLLEQIAAALKIPVAAFQNFDEEQTVNIITNTFNDHSCSNGSINYNAVFNINPVKKWLEATQENKLLYERMLKDRDRTITMLQTIIEDLSK